MAARTSSREIVGRDTELRVLNAAWLTTPGHEGRLVLVSGEPGIGKTRLARVFAEHVRRDGGRVLSGTCLDLRHEGMPYAPVRQALRSLTQSDDGREVMEQYRDRFTMLFPDLDSNDTASQRERDNERVRLYESLLQLLHDLAAHHRVLLVIDDAQWADRATLDVVTFLTHNLGRVQALILILFRECPPRSDCPLHQFLVGQSSHTVRVRLTLGQLDERSVTAQIEDIIDDEPDPQLVDDVIAKADGNPYFVEELLATATEHRTTVPSAIHEILLSRLEGLDEVSRTVLRCAAVTGRNVSHDTLAGAGDITEPQFSEALRTLIDARILDLDSTRDGYRFRHALLRELIYGDLLPAERRRLHLRYAERLSDDLPQTIGMVASHYDLGGEHKRALAAYIEASGTAERSFAFDTAAKYLRRAVELYDVVDDARSIIGMDKVVLLSHAIEAALAIKDADNAILYARNALELVDPREQPGRAGMLQTLRAQALLLAGTDQEADSILVATLRLLPSTLPRERAEVLAYRTSLLALAGRLVEARSLGTEALQVARRAGAIAEECRALLTTGSTTARLGDVRGFDLIDEGEAIARRHHLPIETMRVYLHRGRALQAYARLADAWHEYSKAAAEAPALGMARRYLLRFQLLAARTLFWLGRWDEARATLHRAREGQRGEQPVLPMLMVATGQWDAAQEWFRRSHSGWLTQDIGPLFEPQVPVELATWLGDYDEAAKQCRQSLILIRDSEELLRIGRLCVAGLRAHADRSADARSHSNLPDDAAELHNRLQGLASANPARADGWGQELAALALTGAGEFSRLNADGDPEPWKSAAHAWDRLSMPYPAIYARFRQAERLLATPSSRGDATELLQGTHAAASTLGAEPLAQLIENAAVRVGTALHHTTPRATVANQTDRWGLTRRERQVLDLLSSGYSNREIGDELFIAEGTASVHVSRILRKLGVSSRGEAMAAVLRSTDSSDDSRAARS